MGGDIALALRSLSESGARLLVTAPLQPDEEVEIELQGPRSPRPIRVVADVVRVKPVPGNVYCVAVTFQKHLAYGDFSLLT